MTTLRRRHPEPRVPHPKWPLLSHIRSVQYVPAGTAKCHGSAATTHHGYTARRGTWADRERHTHGRFAIETYLPPVDGAVRDAERSSEVRGRGSRLSRHAGRRRATRSFVTVKKNYSLYFGISICECDTSFRGGVQTHHTHSDFFVTGLSTDHSAAQLQLRIWQPATSTQATASSRPSSSMALTRSVSASGCGLFDVTCDRLLRTAAVLCVPTGVRAVCGSSKRASMARVFSPADRRDLRTRSNWPLGRGSGTNNGAKLGPTSSSLISITCPKWPAARDSFC